MLWQVFRMFRIGGWNQSLKSKPKHLKPNISKQHMRVTQAQRRSPKNLGLESKWLEVLGTSEIRSMILKFSGMALASRSGPKIWITRPNNGSNLGKTEKGARHASLGTSWHHPAIGNIRRCHQALAWILGPWFLSWRHFWHVLLGPRDSISNIFFLITRWVISSLWILSPKPFAVFFYILHCFYRGVKPGILSRALWSQTSWILSQILA